MEVRIQVEQQRWASYCVDLGGAIVGYQDLVATNLLIQTFDGASFGERGASSLRSAGVPGGPPQTSHGSGGHRPEA